MSVVEETYDVVIVGAGHAGCEAALAAARLGMRTIIFTVSMDSVALMPCNPNIGGSSKGHLVREIDALGGEMGLNIDKTYIQSKMLNSSKGPAVHSLRAQADKGEYTKQMRLTLQREPLLTLRQGEVTELLTEDGAVAGVRTNSGAVYHAGAVVLCTGVYLKAMCIYGDTVTYTGPNGLMAANGLSASLIDKGIRLRRFKTGTPPRIDRKTVDFSKMSEQFGDREIQPFSFMNARTDIEREQISCWLTYTSEKTHAVIRENIDRSPLFSGVIKGRGPRYCPSIEDKVMKFPDKDRHQLFLEPEGEFTNEMYLDGLSSSMPEDVQYSMVHSIAGLEDASIVRAAYAIEYDCIYATDLTPGLESKVVPGLFMAGQINGSSGYEEAAAQGLVAGINAERYITGKEPLVLRRSDGYIGVLIDDLVTKETAEPYRMMTSRAEYRLLLRQDNADIRLTGIGRSVGLVKDDRYALFTAKKRVIEEELSRIASTPIGAAREVQSFLTECGSSPLDTGVTLADLIRRPELSYELVAPIDQKRPDIHERYTQYVKEACEQIGCEADFRESLIDWKVSEIINQINVSIKYQGYIERQQRQINQFIKLEDKRIPDDINYEDVKNLRIEARQKLSEIRPQSIGQASRISGVSPADITMLMLYLK